MYISNHILEWDCWKHLYMDNLIGSDCSQFDESFPNGGTLCLRTNLIITNAYMFLIGEEH